MEDLVRRTADLMRVMDSLPRSPQTTMERWILFLQSFAPLFNFIYIRDLVMLVCDMATDFNYHFEKQFQSVLNGAKSTQFYSYQIQTQKYPNISLLKKDSYT